MSPKAKYTSEEIINAAVDLAAERGIKALTARELGAALGTSSRPIFTALGDMATLSVEVIQRDYDLSYENAKMLFKHNWINTYAIGALIATGVCRFALNEIQDMLSREFVAMLMLIKSGRAESCTTIPEKK